MSETQAQPSLSAFPDEPVLSIQASPARAVSRSKPKTTKSKIAANVDENDRQAEGPLMTAPQPTIPQSIGGFQVPVQVKLATTTVNDSFQEIEKLQDCGINAADLKKLKEAGLHSALSIIYTTRKDLCNIKGLSEQKVEKILEAAKKLTDAGFVSGVEFARQKSATRFHISTGAPRIDALLGGGFESCGMTELFGEFRCGKTQICHAISVIAQLPHSMGGANGKVCYIDTENTFRPDRVTAIAVAYNLDPNQVLANILYARCYTSDHLVQLLTHVAAKMAEEKYGLMIVDSIMAPFRVDFSGRGELAERQQILSKVLSRMQKLSEEFNIPVVMTNQVMADPAAAMTFAANPPKPIGGHILAHFSTTRLALRKGRAEQRVMKIIDSPCLAEADAVFEICEKGIQDAKE